MSIITRRGDDGYTDMMFGGRVAKTCPAVIACGAVDELSSCLGMVRVAGVNAELEQQIDTIQRHLVGLMGLLAVPVDQREAYHQKGYPGIAEEEIDFLERIGQGLTPELDGWARPGACGDECAARLDLARSVCRRAELATWGMEEAAPVQACRYLNRLSDILWLWARHIEQQG